MEINFTYDSFVKAVRQLFETNKLNLTQDDKKFIDECIVYGEPGVAYEALVPLLYEYRIPITKESYELAVEIGMAMKHEESYWLSLKELIIKI